MQSSGNQTLGVHAAEEKEGSGQQGWLRCGEEGQGSLPVTQEGRRGRQLIWKHVRAGSKAETPCLQQWAEDSVRAEDRLGSLFLWGTGEVGHRLGGGLARPDLQDTVGAGKGPWTGGSAWLPMVPSLLWDEGPLFGGGHGARPLGVYRASVWLLATFPC